MFNIIPKFKEVVLKISGLMLKYRQLRLKLNQQMVKWCYSHLSLIIIIKWNSHNKKIKIHQPKFQNENLQSNPQNSPCTLATLPFWYSEYSFSPFSPSTLRIGASMFNHITGVTFAVCSYRRGIFENKILIKMKK